MPRLPAAQDNFPQQAGTRLCYADTAWHDCVGVGVPAQAQQFGVPCHSQLENKHMLQPGPLRTLPAQAQPVSHTNIMRVQCRTGPMVSPTAHSGGRREVGGLVSGGRGDYSSSGFFMGRVCGDDGCDYSRRPWTKEVCILALPHVRRSETFSRSGGRVL